MEHEWEETTYADSQAAVISAPAQLNRPVSTSESSTIDERKFFVGGIPADAWDRDLEDLFREFGDVDNVKIIVDPRTQRHRGFGFVEMKTAEAAASVLRQDRHSIRGRPVQVRRMEHEGVSLARKIFVGGINPVLEESTLESYFSRFGPVEQTTIVRDAVTGRAKGFGFVVFSTDEAARAVLQSRVHMVTANDKVDIRPAESRKKWDIGILEYSIQSRKGLGPARAYSTTHDVYCRSFSHLIILQMATRITTVHTPKRVNRQDMRPMGVHPGRTLQEACPLQEGNLTARPSPRTLQATAAPHLSTPHTEACRQPRGTANPRPTHPRSMPLTWRLTFHRTRMHRLAHISHPTAEAHR
ncbi:MAG: uncharacterized protein KVP18_004271 [Porospora cf. gigantea A]|uniref:uncharacterized protein n=1 Tax=Porospora cf. gigantea A TaxID=2853593 RepID=UPI003559DDBE|nr:MAG: hypothetical protein KVP18_004271 [Porospora cf. gigantea A]